MEDDRWHWPFGPDHALWNGIAVALLCEAVAISGAFGLFWLLRTGAGQ